jgi:hypothetical protein
LTCTLAPGVDLRQQARDGLAPLRSRERDVEPSVAVRRRAGAR